MYNPLLSEGIFFAFHQWGWFVNHPLSIKIKYPTIYSGAILVIQYGMNSYVWIYFSKSGLGYELLGTDIISGIDAFLNCDDTFLIEYSYSDLMNSMHFFVYEWDNSQKKRKTVFESYRKELALMGMVKHIDKLPNEVRLKILSMYVDEGEELELEKNANS